MIIYICVYTYTHVCTEIYLHMTTYICVYTYIYIYIYVLPVVYCLLLWLWLCLLVSGLTHKYICGPNYACSHKKPTKQVRSKRTFQIWRLSKIPADVGSQVLIQGFISKQMCNPKYSMYALTRNPTNNFVQNVPPKSDGLQKFQPTLDHRFCFQGFM